MEPPAPVKSEPTIPATSEPSAPQVVMMWGHELDPPDNDVRAERDIEAVREMAASLKKLGSLAPVVARRLPGRKKPVVEMGETRRLGAIEAGVQIQVIIYDRPLTLDEVEERQVVENRIRRQLTPVDIALVVMGRMERKGINQKQAAAELGFTRTEVCNALKIFKRFPKDLLAKVASREIASSKAAALANIKDPEELRFWAKQAMGGGAKRDFLRGKFKTRGRRDAPKARPLRVKHGGAVVTFADPAPQAMLGLLDGLARAIRKWIDGGADPAKLQAFLGDDGPSLA